MTDRHLIPVRIEGEKPTRRRRGKKGIGFLSCRDRWLKATWDNIEYRCTNPKDRHYASYGGLGVENRLTLDDLRALYDRDRPDLMCRPSIDRVETTGHYELSNCQFLEFEKNQKKRRTRPCSRCGGEREQGDGATVGNRRYKRCNACAVILLCSHCKKEFEGEGYVCEACRYETRPCAYCKKPVTRDMCANEGHSTARNKNWFCTREEFHQFHAAHMRKGRKAKRAGHSATTNNHASTATPPRISTTATKSSIMGAEDSAGGRT